MCEKCVFAPTCSKYEVKSMAACPDFKQSQLINKIWAIKNTTTGAYFRNNVGNILFFMSHADAQDYIDRKLPRHLWDAVDYKR